MTDTKELLIQVLNEVEALEEENETLKAKLGTKKEKSCTTVLTQPSAILNSNGDVTLRTIEKEKKTKRIQLVVEPSLYDLAKETAEASELSFNSYITNLIINDINGKGAK